MRYTATPSDDGIAWGVTDGLGAISYQPDMTEMQARIVAMFHNNEFAQEFDKICAILEDAGIDFEAL